MLIGLTKKIALAVAGTILLAAAFVALDGYWRERTHAAHMAEAEVFARAFEERFKGVGLAAVEQDLRRNGHQYELGGRSNRSQAPNVRDVWVALANEPSLHWYCSTVSVGAALEFDEQERLVSASAGSWEEGCL